jgi:RimJ/RimL family protein N-acetyltransferase
MKDILHKTISAAKSIMFLLLNSIEYLSTPEIDELSNGNLKIIAYNNKYLGDVINLWRTAGYFSNTYKSFLRLFGNRFCFLLLNGNNELLGFFCFYYRFEDLGKRRIHAALKIIDPKVRGKGYGGFLHKSAFNIFGKTKWIRGISASYAVSDEATRRTLQKYGYKFVDRHFDTVLDKEMEDVVYDFC